MGLGACSWSCKRKHDLPYWNILLRTFPRTVSLLEKLTWSAYYMPGMVVSSWHVLTHFFPQCLTHLDTRNLLGWVAPASLSISPLGERHVHTDVNGRGLESGTLCGCYNHQQQHYPHHTWPLILALSWPSWISWIMRQIGILSYMALALGCMLETSGE